MKCKRVINANVLIICLHIGLCLKSDYFGTVTWLFLTNIRATTSTMQKTYLINVDDSISMHLIVSDGFHGVQRLPTGSNIALKEL